MRVSRLASLHNTHAPHTLTPLVPLSLVHNTDVTAGKTRVADLEAEAATSKEREETLSAELEELKTAAQATEEKLVATGAAATAAQGEAGAELEKLRGEVSETAEKLAVAEASLEQTRSELAAAEETFTTEKTRTDELTARVSELDTGVYPCHARISIYLLCVNLSCEGYRTVCSVHKQMVRLLVNACPNLKLKQPRAKNVRRS